ncbi:MAG: hypothetical protein JW789_04115 [Candidatus Aenigmarchaeota archaeon]|nr:hypothetical protein [Candidatus Aenigmarchaeota archaeon]
MHKWDKTFWMMFVLLETVIIAGNIWFFTPVGVIVGFVLIAIALARFGDYLLHKENKHRIKKSEDSVEKMKGWLNNQYQLTQGIKDLHDYRFHKMEKKKIILDEKIDRNYRDIAGKLIDLENRLNMVSRALISQRNAVILPDVIEKPIENVIRREKDFFEDVWRKITDMTEKKGFIETLSRGVKNKVLEIGSNGMKIRSEMTSKERFIEKKDFRYFWEKLQAKGKLDLAKDVNDPNLLRLGSVIIAVLARLPNVEHDLKPRVLYLMNENTHNIGTLKRLRKKI